MGDRRASAPTVWVRITNINLNKWPAIACSGLCGLALDQLLKVRGGAYGCGSRLSLVRMTSTLKPSGISASAAALASSYVWPPALTWSGVPSGASTVRATIAFTF